MPAKVLVAGCGLSGAATSWFLRQMTNSASVRILEAADAVGGRMATHRWSPPEPEPSLDLSLHGQADTGAQYLTQYKEEHSAVFDHLVEKGVIAPFDATSGIIEGIKPTYARLPHFLASKGIDSVVRSFVDPDEVSFQTTLHTVNVKDGKLWTSWRSAYSVQSAKASEVDYLVLALPAPTALQLEGNLWDAICALPTESIRFHSDTEARNGKGGDLLEALRRVTYSARYAMAAHFHLTPDNDRKVDGTDLISSILPEGTQQVWRAKYVSDDADIRYLSLENFKRTIVPPVETNPSTQQDGAVVSVLVHSSLPLYSNLQAQSSSSSSTIDASQALLSAIYRHLPQLSVASDNGSSSTASRGDKSAEHNNGVRVALSTAKLVSWDISQVSQPFRPSASALVSAMGENVGGALHSSLQSVSTDVPVRAVSVDFGHSVLVLTGDYFTSSNFEGCLDSASATARFIATHLRSQEVERQR